MDKNNNRATRRDRTAKALAKNDARWNGTPWKATHKLRELPNSIRDDWSLPAMNYSRSNERRAAIAEQVAA